MIDELKGQIRMKNIQIQIEKDVELKQELHNQLRKLQLKLEIAEIKKRIEQLG